MKILMVCLGNICRSPLAEGILQHKAKAAGLNWIVESAGTNGYHTGEPPHHLSQKVALLNGINISNQKSRKFIAKDLNEYDIIYPMANDVLQDIKRISGNTFNSQKVILFLNEIFINQMNISITHEGDVLSDDDVFGSLNIKTDRKLNTSDSHKVKYFLRESTYLLRTYKSLSDKYMYDAYIKAANK